MTANNDSLQQVNAYVEQHKTYVAGELIHGAPWAKQIQIDAIERLQEYGFPNNRDEEWRYTDTKYLFKTKRVINHTKKNDSFLDFDIEKINQDNLRVVYVDGVFQPQLSDMIDNDNLLISTVEDAIKHSPELVKAYLANLSNQYEQGWTILNTAFIQQGAVILAKENAQIKENIEVIHLSTGNAELNDEVELLRHIIVAEKNSKLSVIERYVGNHQSSVLSNVVSELYCEDGADLTRVVLQEHGDKTTQIHHSYLRQGAKAHIHNFTFSLSGRLMRNEFYGQILGEESECKMYGIYAPNGRQHIDNCTQIEHMVPNCVSDELYKGVLDDYSRSVFRGRIYVAQDAQKTDAYQTNRNLILSRNAEADTKPQLEIYADDVKCSHGATIGELDKEQLFYLRSRGVEENEARKLLIYAFVGEVLDSIDNSQLKDYVEEALRKQLLKGKAFAKESSEHTN